VNCGSTINSLQFTRDDKEVVVCGNYQTPQPEGGTKYTGFAKRLEVKSGNIMMECGGVYKASVKSVRFTPDEKLVATGNFAHEVSVFEMGTGKKVAMFNHPLK